MYVCLCKGVTSQAVADAVAAGATTTKKVAKACGAGSECGRCRRTIQAVIKAADSEHEDDDRASAAKRVRRFFR